MSQTVLITGASQRIGKELAKHFAGHGWNVIIHCNRSWIEATTLSEQLNKEFPGGQYPVFQSDFTNGSESVKTLFGQLPPGIERIDALINNASVFKPGNLSETSPELWKLHMSVNFETPFLLMQAFHDHFGSGSIVNILDTDIVNHHSSHAVYLLSKKALRDLTIMAALEWGPTIRVNAVAPGPVLPPAGKDDAYLESVAESTPLKRPVKLDHLVESVYFLINNYSVTGQVIFCDSGAHINH